MKHLTKILVIVISPSFYNDWISRNLCGKKTNTKTTIIINKEPPIK